MGGKALKNCFTRRYKKDEYFELSKIVVPKIEKLFNTNVWLVNSYFNKESHGDMDILIDGKFEAKYIYSKLESLKPKEIVRNSNVYSFEYNEFQIDLIFTKPKFFNASKLFFEYGDLGNFVGKLYNKMDIKYSFEGLKYCVYYKDVIVDTIHLTDDKNLIFPFLGLDIDTYNKGFFDEKDVFDYIVTSKYFKKRFFELKNLSQTNRKRNKRRKGYLNFLEYLKNVEERDFVIFPTIEEISEYFNVNIQEQKDIIINKFEINEKINAKFNGRDIIRLAGVEGKDVGILKHNFFASFTDYKQFFLNHSKEEIEKEFLLFIEDEDQDV